MLSDGSKDHYECVLQGRDFVSKGPYFAGRVTTLGKGHLAPIHLLVDHKNGLLIELEP